MHDGHPKPHHHERNGPMMTRRPIVVAGMHRSGTSFVASLLAATGIRMGDQLVAANAANPRGYFEDIAFLDLNRTMLLRATNEDEEGHPDWGWTVGQGLDRSSFEQTREIAKALISIRQADTRPWGWKDPRTTLTLDFWHDLLLESGCDPLYVFPYRFPWDVADSMQRIGADLFLRNPEYAARIWSFYNRNMLSFYERHREQCLLISTNTLWQDPERFRLLLAARLQQDIDISFNSLSDGDLWRARSGDDPLISLFAAVWPECVELLSELDARADLSAKDMWSSPQKLRPRNISRPTGSTVDLSIILPCYNHGEFLIDAVASAERYAPDLSELIIVNDGSDQPRTLSVLETLRHAGYRVLDQPNNGLASERNAGIAIARGRYLLPLDADNRICEGFAQTAISILDQTSEVGIVYGDRYDFGKRQGRTQVPVFDLQKILLANYIDACAIWESSMVRLFRLRRGNACPGRLGNVDRRV